MGNYISQKDFEEISMRSCEDKGDKGMKMLGILKADVDNLGKIFSIGLKEKMIITTIRFLDNLQCQEC